MLLLLLLEQLVEAALMQCCFLCVWERGEGAGRERGDEELACEFMSSNCGQDGSGQGPGGTQNTQQSHKPARVAGMGPPGLLM